MTIALGCDHGGLELKNVIIEHLKKRGMETLDCGAFDDASSDYPDYAMPACEAVLAGRADFAVLICGTGVGMSMSANKICGIRCAVVSDIFSAKATRSHNDANVLALGARVVGHGLALELVDGFLDTPYSGDARHARRIEKIMNLEKR